MARAPSATAKAVRYHRIRARLSVDQLADLAGIAGWTIHKIESGRVRTPHMATLAALADALEVDITQLIDEELVA